MMKRQRSLRIQVLRLYREPLDGVAFNVLTDEPGERERYLQLADADFDHHFPMARNTEQAGVFAVFDQPFCLSAQLGASFDEPEKSVCVEQELHDEAGMYSLKSSSGSSKSSLIQT